MISCTAPMLPSALGQAAAGPWEAAGESRGVALESGPGLDAYKAFRGSVKVCTDLQGLQAFVADASRLAQWIPFTEEARALSELNGNQLYYLKSSAPWPFRSRDMVYELVPLPPDGTNAIRIRLQGRPGAVPEREDAVRMRAARGLWSLTPRQGYVEVALELAVDPVRAPAFFANRRLAATVGGTLANLAQTFPCRN